MIATAGIEVVVPVLPDPRSRRNPRWFAIARNKARELVAGVKIGGRDPMAEREANVPPAGRQRTRRLRLAARYVEEHAKRNKRLRAWKEDERKLRVEVLPVWGSRQAAEIRRADVRALLEKIAAERERLSLIPSGRLPAGPSSF